MKKNYSMFLQVCGVARGLCIVVLSLVCTGCSWLVEQTQQSISSQPASVELVTVTTKVKAVLACIKTPKGICPAQDPDAKDILDLTALQHVWASERIKAEGPAKLAVQAFEDPTVTALGQIMSYASGTSDQGQAPVSLSRMSTRTFAKNLYDATNTGGWTRLSINLRSSYSLLDARSKEAVDLKRAIDLTQLVGDYLAAYFQKGQVVSLSIDPSHIEASALSELQSKLGLSADVAKTTVNDIVKDVTGQEVGSDGMYHLLTAKDDGGFVTRGGDKYSFPAVSITVTPGTTHTVTVSKVDFAEVGADVVRVFIEAVGDYLEQLPGTPKSTGVQVKFLAAFGNDPSIKLDANQFTQVEDWSSRAETATAAGTGQIIRGLGWVSLNNEALAKIIETAAGVAVRKAAEKVTWCVEACGIGTERELIANGSGEIRVTRVKVIE